MSDEEAAIAELRAENDEAEQQIVRDIQAMIEENAQLKAENATLRTRLAAYTGITETVTFAPHVDGPTSNPVSDQAAIDLQRTR